MDPIPARPAPSAEEQLLKGGLQLSPVPALTPLVDIEPPEISTRYCEELLGQALVPANLDEHDGRSWMTADGEWFFTETDKPVMPNGLGGHRDTGRKEWTVGALAHVAATSEEPASTCPMVAATVDDLNAAIIKAAELIALERIRVKVEAIYGEHLAKEEEAIDGEDDIVCYDRRKIINRNWLATPMTRTDADEHYP